MLGKYTQLDLSLIIHIKIFTIPYVIILISNMANIAVRGFCCLIIFFSTTTMGNFNKIWHKASLEEGCQVYSIEGPQRFPRGANYEIAKMDLN